MQMTTAIRLLQTLPTKKESAMSVANIASQWFDGLQTASDIRNIQRYMTQRANGVSHDLALIDVVNEGAGRRYYLRSPQVAQWFMTAETALHVLVTSQHLCKALRDLDVMNNERLVNIADVVIDKSASARFFRDRVRVIQDGIGRLPACIDHSVLKQTIEAINKRRQLAFHYLSSSGKSSFPCVTCLGVVAKDGTLYLLGSTGLTDSPRHFPLQRMSEAEISHFPAQSRPDFDLDDYIERTHMLSHSLDVKSIDMRLRLRVAPEAMYHFLERPLSAEQYVDPLISPDAWRTVTATVPHTILLIPFLLSMGPWIEVLDPPEMRAAVKASLGNSSMRYV